ncbi:MAG: RagB/SusD family nutrient uptake outer membrane protein, partial [Bacteroides sp.]
MKTKIKLLLTALVFICCSCDSFLTRDPLDKIENTPEFYNRESNVRSSIFGLYDEYFVGYNKGWNRNDWFEGTNVAEWVDDLAQIEATHFTKQAPSTSSRWGFELVRRINIIIAGVENSELANEVKNHWVGVGRFLRAMEYSKLVRTFGDVPYFDKEVVSTDIKTLYKPRDPRSFVMDKVLEDLEFAAEHVRLSDGEKGLTINRDVVMAYASRIL